MLQSIASFLMVVALVEAHGFPSHCPRTPARSPNATLGVCPNDFTIIGPPLEAVHESVQAPTGLALDNDLNIYIAYPRNSGPTPNNVVIATSFTSEEPWPSAEFQNCTTGQNVSTCFINVQNPILGSDGNLYLVDSGIAPGATSPTPGGAKVLAISPTTRQLLRVWPIPSALFYDGLNLNDLRVNLTLGSAGFAFLTDASKGGSILSVDLATGQALRRLHNATVVMPDPTFVGSYNGQTIYSWNGTRRSFTSLGSDGIALASGNVYWGNLASRRFYYAPQTAFIDPALSEADVLAKVQDPGECATEQAGFTADDKGRVYILASEQNAIYYVDTQQSEATEEINGTPPGGEGPVKAENYVVRTLVRSGLVQHADSAAIVDGWLYFCTNQLELSPRFQYKNVDRRRGPFRTYRVWIGRGPAV
ncbi:hypothetical protein KVT40_001171 [Elsinoe batatas]|uniref:Major royal jelly protein n=1 Tax=Elsinoe batatas TaxID=2601811 RepID=A0A8K0LCL8_9PEZI|nr:hypothetical protein KVT40_001171 [Elsinoe batatas]